MTNSLTYLALGDSYTIGEGVPLYDSFPYQLVQLLRNRGKHVSGPEIVAKTGWTTSELMSHLDHILLSDAYSFVTLLIGVNNQYRDLSPGHFELDLRDLVQKAVTHVKNDAKKVIVMSIPDWGKSPFALDRNPKKIGEAISLFNQITKEVALKHGCTYVDITSNSPETTAEPSFFAADALHPAPKAYKRWVLLLSKQLERLI